MLKNRNFDKLFIIGGHKCGTTSLDLYVSDHGLNTIHGYSKNRKFWINDKNEIEQIGNTTIIPNSVIVSIKKI